MELNKRLSEEEYRFVYSKAPRLCVDLVIRAQNRLVLTQRAIEPFKGTWHFPGGRVFYKESIEEAIKRVTRGELGVEVKPGRFLGYLEILNDGEYIHSVSMVFLASIACGKLKGDFQSTNIQSFRSIPDNTHSYHKDFLEKHWSEILP